MRAPAILLGLLLLSGPALGQRNTDFGLPVPYDKNLTATGFSQSTALPIKTKVSVFATVPALSGTLLPSNTAAGTQIEIYNEGANPLLVYPSDASAIDKLAPNTPYQLPPGGEAMFTALFTPTSSARGTWVSAPYGSAPIIGSVPVTAITGLGSGIAASLQLPASGAGASVLAASPGIASPTLTGTTIVAGLTASGNISAASFTASGALTADSLTLGGSLTAGSISTVGPLAAGPVTAGAITAASLTATGGSVSAASLTATGSISASNLTATGLVSASSLNATGGVSANSLTAATINATSSLIAASINATGTLTAASINAVNLTTSSVTASSVTASSPATITSLTTSQATASGTVLAFANPTGLRIGQVASGTNIPANDPLIYVSGGTAVVALTVPIGVATGATLLALSDTTGLTPNMLVLDTTTAVIPANTLINAISVASNAPVTNLVGAISGINTLNINVAAGGTACLPGMLVFDTTTAGALAANTVATASTATTIKINAGPAGGGVLANDVIQCYPAVALSVATTGAVLTSDALLFSPTAILQNATTGAIAAAATINFSATASALGSTVSSTDVINAGPGGYQQQGQTLLRAFGNSNNKFLDGYGTVTLVGLGAGANLSPADYLTTAVGWHALFKSPQANSESTAVGFVSQANITSGGYNTTEGVSTLFTCLICVHDLALATDALRNTLTASFDIAMGVSTLINDGSNGFNIAIGDSTYPGNVGGIGQYNIVLGHSAFTSTVLTTAAQNFFAGQGAAGGGAVTSASNNVGAGHLVLQSLSTGSNNTDQGFQAGNKTTTGNNNLCEGSQACYGVTTGSNNVVLAAVSNANLNELTTGIGNILIGFGSTVPSATGNGQISIGNTYYGGTIAPIISSGFGTSPSIPKSAGTAAFTVNVGTGGTASSGIINLATQQLNGYICQATDHTNPASFVEAVTQASAGQITITNYPRAGGAAVAWTAGDVLEVMCAGY